MSLPVSGPGVDTPACAGRAPDALTSPLPASLIYVTFGSRTSTRPIEHAATWDDLAAQLTHHARRPGKDGPGWSPAVYKRKKDGTLPTRANDSVQELTCAVADVDHVEMDDVVTLREHVRGLGLACVVYSTHSSSETAPRVRVVVPFAEPVPAETWPRLWPTLNERLFLGLADRAASDASRFYYLPAAPPDALVIAENRDGLALDWRGLPLADPQPTADRVETAGAGPAQTVDPEDMPILERLFSGRRGEQRMRAWMGDYADFGGNASSADQSIANGLVVYCRGDVEHAERIMRAGAWRPKWDERRGATTWLGYTLGKALAAYRAWAGSQGGRDEPGAAEETPTPPAGETTEQIIARLEGELAAERRGHAQDRALIATQQTIIRAERAERDALAEQLRGWKVILSNPKLKPADRIVAIPLVEHVRDARRNGQDEIHVRYPGIVSGWGIPESTVQKSADILTEMDGAVLAKRSEPGPAITVETKHGPRSVTPPMVLLRATVDGDLYVAVGAYDPGLPQRGGKREPPPPCPVHPTADYIERTVPQCADCRRPLGQARERFVSRRQNEGLTDGASPTVGVRTLRRQNEGLTGHDGAEQSERAARVIPLPPPRARRERFEQPSWLDQWPDAAPAAVPPRFYDDVAIPSVSGGSE